MLTNTNPQPQESPFLNPQRPVLKVLGLGGGGCNAVERMMELNLRGVEYIAANTDHQALEKNQAPVKIQLGPQVTRGLGAGGNPQVGQAAALESWREIMAALNGADMVFLTAGMGGGTGTGSIPVAAEIARSLGAVTIAVVTTPFSFEMGRRQKNASAGLTKLREHTHTLIAIPNDRLLYVAPRNLPMEVAFRLADDVLRQSVQGIAELITEPGLINVDFAHVRRLIRLGGGALMSIGQGQGEGKAEKAVEQALHHPLLESVSLENAAGIIANFTGGDDLTLLEVEAALARLQAETGPQTDVVMGVINDERMQGRSQVILVVTGLGAPTLEETMAAAHKTAPAPAVESEPVMIRSINSFSPQPSPLPVSQPDAEPAPLPASIPAGYEKIPPRQTASAMLAEFAAGSSNLDIPAFLRRRTRTA
jgi:cell division protein FtsZ